MSRRELPKRRWLVSHEKSSTPPQVNAALLTAPSRSRLGYDYQPVATWQAYTENTFESLASPLWLTGNCVPSISTATRESLL